MSTLKEKPNIRKFGACRDLGAAASLPLCRDADSVSAEARAAPLDSPMPPEGEWPGEEMEGMGIDGVHTRVIGRILVVDDEISIVENLVASLLQFGYEATGIVSAGEALKVLKEQDFDMLLTDLKLGGMDGIELLREALKVRPDLTGIIMTGYATVETAVKAMKCGAFDYVMKPFMPSRLLPVLSRAMEVRRLRTENIHLRETVAIYDLARAIAFPLNDDAILNKVAEVVQRESQADEVSIMLPTLDGLSLYVAAARGNHEEHSVGTRIALKEGAADWMAGTRHEVLLLTQADDDRSCPIGLRPDVHMALFMPVIAGGTFEGIINANFTRNGNGFTPGQLKALRILAGILAPRLETSRLFTEVRAAEEKYRSIFENSIEGIFQATPDGRYLSVNPALARMYGYPSPEEMMEAVEDIRAEQFVDPADRDRLTALYESQGFVEQFESQRRRQDGESIWTSVNAKAVRDGEGHLRYYEGTTIDISRRKKAEEELRAARARLQSLSRSLLRKMEAERHKIARELHDEIGQSLTAVKLKLQSLQRQSYGRAIASAFLESIAMADVALSQVRSLSLNLRPSILDDMGLVAAVQWLTEQMERSSHQKIQLTADGLPRLPAEVEIACFRVVQEAITNAARHAKARTIVVSLCADEEELRCSVGDDGVGFDERQAIQRAVHGESMGLVGMQERSALVDGSVSITSTPGKGTEITARFPLGSY